MCMVKHHQNIDDFLNNIRIPRMKNPLLYIIKIEDYDTTKDDKSSFLSDYFIIVFNLGYDANLSIGENTVNALENNLSFVSSGQTSKWELKKMQPEALSFFLLFKPDFLLFPQGINSFFETFPFFNNYIIPHYKIIHANKRH